MRHRVKSSIVLRPHRFAALEDLDFDVEINIVWETIGENITISAKASLGFSKLLYQWKKSYISVVTK
jgi:hypothetical protein